MKKRTILGCALLCVSLSSFGDDFLKPQSYQYPNGEPAPYFPVPSERQMAWHETEFYAFYHYGMNTYTDKEWGYGNETESLFAPTAVPNCLQWVQTAKKAGMKGGIAVVKHHDGFCLWPTETTQHNITKGGGVAANQTINVPQLFGKASQDEGMKYGFYISPWDRNSAFYGTDKYVKDVFLKQVSELCKYGNDQFEMWFDGANGGDGYYGGQNKTISIDASTYYDKPNLADTIHKLLPNCVIWGGEEAHWVGNENGVSPITSWCTVDEDGWKWLPAEADAKSTSKGWFWHNGQTSKSAAELFKMYLETVGRNTTLILNIPPNKAGVLPSETVTAMTGLGNLLSERLGNDLAKQATITASDSRNEMFSAAKINDGNKETYWAASDGTISNVTITLTWPLAVKAHYVSLQEYIRKGQRVKNFKIETSTDGSSWTQRANDQCTTIGYKRIVPLNGSTSNYGDGYSVKAIRITLLNCKACPTLHTVSVY